MNDEDEGRLLVVITNRSDHNTTSCTQYDFTNLCSLAKVHLHKSVRKKKEGWLLLSLMKAITVVRAAHSTILASFLSLAKVLFHKLMRKMKGGESA